MKPDMLDFYYSKAEFHLIQLDKNYEVTTHKISKKQIKDVPHLSMMKVKALSINEPIFWEHTVTPKELFGLQIKKIHLADKRTKDDNYITRLVLFERKEKYEI